jgi:hypothetical protein
MISSKIPMAFLTMASRPVGAPEVLKDKITD